jgi:hypothetical protein
MVDFHKSGSSLGVISKHLKEPRSTVQTTVCKYKHYGSLRDERTFLRKVQIIPRTTAKDLVKMLEEIGTKVYTVYPQEDESCIDNLEGRSARKKPLFQNRRKKDYGLQLHIGTKITLFGEMSSVLMKQK